MDDSRIVEVDTKLYSDLLSALDPTERWTGETPDGRHCFEMYVRSTEAPIKKLMFVRSPA